MQDIFFGQIFQSNRTKKKDESETNSLQLRWNELAWQLRLREIARLFVLFLTRIFHFFSSKDKIIRRRGVGGEKKERDRERREERKRRRKKKKGREREERKRERKKERKRERERERVRKKEKKGKKEREKRKKGKKEEDSRTCDLLKRRKKSVFTSMFAAPP